MGTVLKVPHIEQTDEWPAGDECLCAVMLLRYLGIRITVNEFVDFFLPQGQMSRREGKLIGCDPEEKFAGSPYEKNAFGCYPSVLIKAINDCFLQKGVPYRAEDATGKSTDELLTEGIGKGVWVCKKDGKTIQWIEGAQCMLLIGSDVNELVFNDPMLPEGAVHYSRMTAVKRHAELDKRAVMVKLGN